jgi:hypothetical protein
MTHEHDDETRLRALFERTAMDASGPTLTKLKARAQDVPTLTRRPLWQRLFAPALAVAVGAGAVVLATGPFSSLKPESVASTRATESAALAPASITAPVLRAPEAAPATAAVDDFGFGEPANDGLLGPLDGPSDDEDIDAWLAATESVLGEQG